MTMNIDIHVLQTVPPSNLNRDETGSPKTALYGGQRRARVSSQAWKRAVRTTFGEAIDSSELGVRTKRALELMEARILTRYPEMPSEEAVKRATDVLAKAGLKTKPRRKAKDADDSTSSERDQTEYLMFFSAIQLEKLAELACQDSEVTAREAKAILKDDNSIDLALFGRMVANDGDLNVDAACQVAHAISTHAVSTEFDYYTAVDDENPEEDTGAGMIGTVEFNSSTLYRFATINVPALLDNLGDAEATARAVSAFVSTFAMSMPTGKQNTFANGTVPDCVVVMARDGRSVNLVGAFENAIKAGSDGYVRASASALASKAAAVDAMLGTGPVKTWVAAVDCGEQLASLGETVSLPQVAEGAAELVRESLAQS